MVFKNIDGNLTTIFTKTKEVSGGFNLVTEEVNKCIKSFNKFNATQNYGEDYFGKELTNFIDEVSSKNQNVANLFKDLAKQGSSAKASVESVYAAILDGNTRGYGNVKSLINIFKSVKPENQEAFAKAIGQTNSQLGNYLINLNGAKAGMLGYAVQLVASTAKTVALKTVTVALNAAITGLISWGISEAFSLLDKWIVTQEELIQSAKQSAQETSEYIDSLSELKEKYLDIVDSESSVSEKTQELNKFKQELIETYGFEKDIIDKLNLSREHGVELLDKEAQKNAQAKRNEFYAQNDEAIQKAVEKVENVRDLTIGGNKLLFNEADVKKLPSYIQDVLDVQEEQINTLDGLKTFTNIKFKADDIFGEYDIVNSIATQLQNKRDEGIQELTAQEEEFLDFLEDYSKELKEKIDNYGETYQTYYKYKAQDLLENYVAQYGNPTNLIGKELDNWKQGLLETAEGNTVLEESLSTLIDTVYQFSDAEK